MALSLLAQYNNQVAEAQNDLPDADPEFLDNLRDVAEDMAIQLITDAGLESESQDALGVVVSDDVQTLLILALTRCPELMAHLASLSENS